MSPLSSECPAICRCSGPIGPSPCLLRIPLRITTTPCCIVQAQWPSPALPDHAAAWSPHATNRTTPTTPGRGRNIIKTTMEDVAIQTNVDDTTTAIIQGLRSLQHIVTLDDFSGTTTCADWLQDFDRFVTSTARITDEDKLYTLISHLTGEAKQWFRVQADDTKDDYATLHHAFKENYSPSSRQLLDLN